MNNTPWVRSRSVLLLEEGGISPSTVGRTRAGKFNFTSTSHQSIWQPYAHGHFSDWPRAQPSIFFSGLPCALLVHGLLFDVTSLPPPPLFLLPILVRNWVGFSVNGTLTTGKRVTLFKHLSHFIKSSLIWLLFRPRQEPWRMRGIVRRIQRMQFLIKTETYVRLVDKTHVQVLDNFFCWHSSKRLLT